MTDFHSDPFRAVYRAEPGAARPAPAAPASKPIWAASAHGKGTQSVIWDVKHGNWSVVVMNADGSRGIDTGVSAGADFPILSALAWGSVGGGLVLLGVASMLIVRQNPVGIERVLDGFVKAPERVVVEGIDVRDVVHVGDVRAVFAPAVFGAGLDQAPEHFAIPLVGFDVVHDREAEQENERARKERPRAAR